MADFKPLLACGLSLSVLALAGCNATPYTGEGEEAFGKAVRHNFAVQVVHPEPKPEASAPSVDGSKAAIAVGRYRSDKVKPPLEIRTSDVGSEGG